MSDRPATATTPTSVPDPAPGEQPPAIAPAERFIQNALIILLVVWCYQVARPFVVPVAWAVIITVSLFPVHERLEAAVNRRRALAASLTTLLALTVLVIPIVYLGDALVATIEHVGRGLDKGRIQIPPPPEGVARVPVVGHTLQQSWLEASRNEGAAFAALERHLKPVGAWLVSAAAGASLAIAQFVVAIFIAGVLLARREPLLAWYRRVALRVAPGKGVTLTALAEATIRNVSQGVIGVALIQALGAGVAFLLAGMPAAGILALLCFILAVAQLGILLVVVPAALYLFFTASLAVAIPFALWCAFLGLIDNVLKPVLLHHGMDTPMWVIVVGSIGGLLSSGVIGLFIGPVLLVLGYELTRVWLAQDDAQSIDAPARVES